MSSDKLNYKIINLLAIFGLLYIVVSSIGVWWNILCHIIYVLTPFLVGFFFAYALRPIVKLLERKKIPKVLANIIVILGTVLIVAALIAIVLPLVYDQLSSLIGLLVKVIDNIGEKYNVNLGPLEIKIMDYLNDALKNLGQIVSSTTIGIITNSISFVSKFIVAFVSFIYFLIDMDKIRARFKDILQSISKRSFEYVRCIDNEMGNYFKGLGIFMIIQLFEYSLLFFVVGHPNWLLLGILACLTTVIPYFGGLITNIIAIITASVISKPLVIATIIICIIFPQVDGYIISPKVYGKTNGVNPLITIMSVSIGGTIAGAWGIVVALPCYLFIRTTYHFFKTDLKKGVGLVKKSI